MWQRVVILIIVHDSVVPYGVLTQLAACLLKTAWELPRMRCV